MYERFTERARKVVVSSQDEARRMGHNYIGTEHLLLGLLREDQGLAARVLVSLGVTLGKAREQVESIVGYGEEETSGQAPFTPRSKKVLELALREALQLGHNYIGTEHLLLGLIQEFGGVAAQVFLNLGIDRGKVRQETVHRLEGGRVRAARNVGQTGSPPHITMFRARVEGLVVRARCGVTDEERATPQPLRVDLSYLYEAAGEEDDLSGTVDYGVVSEEVAELLEREEFRLLETGVRMVGENVLAGFPPVREVTVSITKLRVPVDREVSGVSVEATFGR
jgi:dihydroneopterin aldolase